MKATRKDHLIIKCARRLINNLDSHRSYTCNDEFAKDVQLELKRMRNHCEQASKRGGRRMEELDISLEEVSHLVTFTIDPDGCLVVDEVYGDVRGNVYGHIFGEIRGDVRGDVLGKLSGRILGQPF